MYHQRFLFLAVWGWILCGSPARAAELIEIGSQRELFVDDMTWGLVQLPGNDKEYSVYATEAYYTGPDSRVRRFTYRVDGFVSVHASAAGGQLVTKPLLFAGTKLTINAATAAGGRIRVALEDADGVPLDGLTLADCQPFRGDAIEHTMTWTGGSNVGSQAGKPVRLRFELQDADLYSLRFTD